MKRAFTLLVVFVLLSCSKDSEELCPVYKVELWTGVCEGWTHEFYGINEAEYNRINSIRLAEGKCAFITLRTETGTRDGVGYLRRTYILEKPCSELPEDY